MWDVTNERSAGIASGSVYETDLPDYMHCLSHVATSDCTVENQMIKSEQ